MNTQSMAAARRKVREAQVKAQEERARRERHNLEDMATFLVARTRLASVDVWEAERVSQVGAEAARRRDEHRLAAASALARMRARGETVSALAELAETTETEVRSYLKLARPDGAAPTAGSSLGVADHGPR
ncbi:hypothetical protein [Mycobacterium sp.]|uniref:hypothetical protein n=1 Tax=Mycobacterium sp. TaxID=1785 RepID=UPI002CABB35D|nr:hypothetical protein [Mycobacterium sp.]HME48100.1 hypothetical protein [Mycobacterium sp.]